MITRTLILGLFLLTTHTGLCIHADSTVLKVASITDEAVLLDNWRFHSGDNPMWADPTFDDSAWESMNPSNDIHELPSLLQNDICWIRLAFTVTDLSVRKRLALLVEQTASSEIYLNGKLLKKYGTFSNESSGAKAAFTKVGEFIPLELTSDEVQVFAIRFEVQKDIPYVNFANWMNRPLYVRLADLQSLPFVNERNSNVRFYVLGVAFSILALLHLVLLVTGLRQKANLNFFIFCLLSALNFSIDALALQYVDEAATWMYVIISMYVLCTGSYFFFLRSVYTMFGRSNGIAFKCISGLFVISIPLFLFYYDYGWISGLVLLPTLVFVESIRASFGKVNTDKSHVLVVRYGAIGFIGLYLISLAFYFGLTPIGYNGLLGDITFAMAFLAMPVALSIKLATESSITNRALVLSITEVQRLTANATQQETALMQLQQEYNQRSRFNVTYDVNGRAQQADHSQMILSADDRFLKRVRSVVEDNLSNSSFDVNTLCREVGISKAQLNRKLHGLAGQSPAHYIRTLRLERAARLLQKQVDNISNVAYMVGYANPAHFSKAFRDLYGHTPSQHFSHSMAINHEAEQPQSPMV